MQEFKENMTSTELLAMSKEIDAPIKEVAKLYNKWKAKQGLIEAPLPKPSEALIEELGSDNILTEAMLRIIERALPMLENDKTMNAGANLIVKVYDSIKGNKGGSSVNVVTNNVTTVEAQKQALVELREKHLKSKGIINE